MTDSVIVVGLSFGRLNSNLANDLISLQGPEALYNSGLLFCLLLLVVMLAIIVGLVIVVIDKS